MRRMLLLALALLLLPIASLLWSGAGGVEQPADFRFINRGEIKTLDPNRMSWLQDIRIGSALWEGLYVLSSKDLEPELAAADRVDVSDDQLVHTFHLRDGARWSNGDPVVSRDFAFAWRRMLEQPGDYTYLFYYIEGAQAYSEGFAASDSQKPVKFEDVGIEVLDDRTLRVKLKHPVTYFPDVLAFAPFYPLHEPSMRKYARTDEATGRVTYDQGFTKPPDLVTNGPYRLASWEFKKRLRLVANQHYWDAKNVKLRVMDQISAEDPFTAFTIYDTGGVDWLSEVHPDVGAALRQIGRPDLRVFSGFGTYFYSLNCQPKLPDGRDNPLKDVRVRRALAMSIDKRPIVENVTRLGESVATTYIPRGIFKDYPSPAGLPFDLARARQELSDAGFPGGRGFPRLTLLFNTGAHHADVAQIIQRQWKQNLGIEVDLEGVEVKDFGNRLRTQQYMIARASWIGDYTDPSTFTDKYLSVSDNNDAKWLNKEYDDLCAQAAVEPDQAKRLQLLARAETILLEAAPIIPMYSYGNSDLVKPYVSGIPKNPRNMINFKSVEVRR